METLPAEMVEYIARMLSPRDLASCYGVSHQWRDIFNQDPVWRQHCNPRLEESLRKIPCTTTLLPPPESMAISHLPPLCHWRLAFKREQLFLRNWRTYNAVETREIIPNFNHDDCKRIDFLTDTLILVFYSSSVEVLDMTSWPAVSVAKSDDPLVGNISCIWQKYELIELENRTTCVSVHENSLMAELYVLREFSLEVYKVDGFEKTICLKNSISLDSVKAHDFLRGYYIVLSENWFTIFCINTQNVLKQCPFPFESNQHDENARYEITTSMFSNVVAVTWFEPPPKNQSRKNVKSVIFSLEQLVFLPSCKVEISCLTGIALHDQYIGVNKIERLWIYNCITHEVVLETPLSGVERGGKPITVKHGFIVEDTMSVKIYHTSRRTMIELFHKGTYTSFLLQCMLTALPSRYFEWIWDVFGHRLNTSQIEIKNIYSAFSAKSDIETNKSFTKVIFKFEQSESPLRYTWKIKNLW